MPVMYWKPIWVIVCITTSLVISAFITWLSTAKLFSNVDHIHLIKHYRTYISIIVQVLSTVLSIGQTYVIGSLVAFSTNSRLTSSRKLPTLDTLKLRQAMVSKSLIWERQTKMKSLISILWLLALQLPAALWAGSITPVLTEAQHEALIPIPHYSETTAAFWATRCVPAEQCDQLLGGISDMGTFSYLAWKSKLVSIPQSYQYSLYYFQQRRVYSLMLSAKHHPGIRLPLNTKSLTLLGSLTMDDLTALVQLLAWFNLNSSTTLLARYRITPSLRMDTNVRSHVSTTGQVSYLGSSRIAFRPLEVSMLPRDTGPTGLFLMVCGTAFLPGESSTRALSLRWLP